MTPEECQAHEIDFDDLQSQKRPKGKYRIVTYCKKCKACFSLDSVLTEVVERIRHIEAVLDGREVRVLSVIEGERESS